MILTQHKLLSLLVQLFPDEHGLKMHENIKNEKNLTLGKSL